MQEKIYYYIILIMILMSEVISEENTCFSNNIQKIIPQPIITNYNILLTNLYYLIYFSRLSFIIISITDIFHKRYFDRSLLYYNNFSIHLIKSFSLKKSGKWICCIKGDRCDFIIGQVTVMVVLHLSSIIKHCIRRKTILNKDDIMSVYICILYILYFILIYLYNY